MKTTKTISNVTNAEVMQSILKLERAALDRWSKGDPSGCLEISAPDVTYFDPFIERRITGLDALARYYEGLRGKISLDRYELIDPNIQVIGDVVVLTFNYASYSGSECSRWNCTEVYRKLKDSWKIIQTHWSLTQPRLINEPTPRP